MENLKTPIKVLLWIVIFFLISFAFATILNFEATQQDIANCHKMARHAKEYKRFYISTADFNFCTMEHGIVINAPVK